MNVSDIAVAIRELEDDRALALVKEAIESKHDPIDVLHNGIMAGLGEIGKRFETGEYFLAELMLGSKLAEQCIAIVDPHLPKEKGPKRGVVVIGAVKGDLHDIGYKLVTMQLELAGYEVYDMGVDVPTMKFIQKAQEVKADFIGLSAFLTTTVAFCGEVVSYLKDMGIREQHKVIIGGANTSQVVADEMGVDGYAANAIQAVKLCERLLGK